MTSTPLGTDEFIELVCADPQLLAAEFDAIIAAEWDLAPPAEPSTGDAVAGPVPLRARSAASRRTGRRPARCPGVAAWARQRSPPP